MTFAEILKRISPTLKRITYRLNGHFSYFNDEDLFQEALVYLWQDYNSGKLENKTDSYILQGCYFHLKNHIRKAKLARGMISLNGLAGEEEGNLEEMLPATDTRAYFAYLDSKILVEKIGNNGLTKREKEVFFLYQEGLTIREIGKRMGISHVRVIKLKEKIKNRYAKIYQELN